MCGFVVLVSTQPPAPQPVSAMLDSIRSRGPDDLSFQQGEWFALGFCRLSIRVLGEAGHQPVTNATADVHLVFNGEIYNFPSLKEQLRRDFEVAAASEAGALLEFYLRYGPSFVEQLDGDFSIVVLDSRSRTCFAFRDSFGVKPLYYASLEDRQTWILSSHIKGFFQHPDFATQLDSVALMERRVLGFWSNERTCFDSIKQVLPGHSLRIQVSTQRDYSEINHDLVPFSSPALPDETRGFELDANGLAVECARNLERAIRKRIEHCDVSPVVLALSGGIDSSLMTTLAHDLRDRLATITIFDSEECQDQEYARQLSKDLGLVHQQYRIKLSEFLEEFPKIVLEMAGPTPNFTPYFLACATKHFYPSAKVLLCGEGADEFFVGYPVLLDSARFWSDCFSRMQKLPTSWLNESPLLRQVRDWKSLRPEKSWQNLIDVFQRDQLVNLHLVPFDHGTMAHGVECRVPYVDHGVVQSIQRVPAHLRVLGNTTKILLRILLSQKLGPDTALAKSLLNRQSSPAFFSTLSCRNWLTEFLEERLPGTELAKSGLARFAMDQENLFWLASVATIFLKHRGQIDGMRFADLTDEVLSGGCNTGGHWTPAWEGNGKADQL